MNITERITSAFSEKAVLDIFNEVSGIKKGLNNEWLGKCPFHSDEKPSFSLNIKTSQYICHACGKSGNAWSYIKDIKNASDSTKWLIEFLKIENTQIENKQDLPILEIKKYIPPEKILIAKKHLLLHNPEKLNLLKQFGISEEIIRKNNIGFSNGQYWIPIKNESGDFVNIRKYNPSADKEYSKWVSYGKGYGSNRLWPIENLNSDIIFLMEGEKDTLVALSLGLNAITNTAGAMSWDKSWGKLFKGKAVNIVMDIDSAGESGEKIRKDNIYPYTAQLKIIKLPLSLEIYPKGDFTNYIIDEGNGKEDFINLVENTKIVSIGEENNDIEYKVILAEASAPQYMRKNCSISDVLICGKDQSPFNAPKLIKAICLGNRNKLICKNCSLQNEDLEKVFDKKDEFLIRSIQIRDDELVKKIKFIVGISTKCFENKYEIKEHYNVERTRLIPDITYDVEQNYEQVYRTAFFVNDTRKKIETNKSYNLKAKTIPDPKTQSIIHQIYEIEPAQGNIDDFNITPDTLKKLKKFQVTTTIKEKLDEIYSEYSNLSSIYGRNDVFLLYDLVYHSIISFNFQTKSIGKGWVEAAIVGDTGVGKSSQAKFLYKYYKAGEYTAGEGASYAGLVGGLTQGANGWSLQWGRLPLNDRRLVIIDEATGLLEEDIAKLSDIRSSGEAKIQKVIQESTRARTRIVWVANPRKQNRGLKFYTYGVFAIKELFGQPEDLRRVDIAMTVASGEVCPNIINKIYEPIIPVYDSDSCHNLIMFAWSRNSMNVKFESGVENLILEKSNEFGNKYSSAIPLVEGADFRNKLARLSVSLATRLFNVDNTGHNVIVGKEHVEFMSDFINDIYSRTRFGYYQYSKSQQEKDELNQVELIADILHLDDIGNVQELLSSESSTIGKTDLSDILDLDDKKELRMNLKILKKANAIYSHQNYYILQPGFLRFLRELKTHYEFGGKLADFLKREKEETLILD